MAGDGAGGGRGAGWGHPEENELGQGDGMGRITFVSMKEGGGLVSSGHLESAPPPQKKGVDLGCVSRQNS